MAHIKIIQEHSLQYADEYFKRMLIEKINEIIMQVNKQNNKIEFIENLIEDMKL